MRESQSPKTQKMSSESNVEVARILKLWGIWPEMAVKAADKIALIRAHHYKGLGRQVETLRRFFVATAGDVRVLLTAFAIRLVELRQCAPDQARALETIEIYAPLANRLGMGRLKAELETTAFPIAYPVEYELTKKLLCTSEKRAMARLTKIYRSLRKDLAKDGVPIISSDYRLKNIYSLYNKLRRPEYNFDIEKVNDLIALRIVTDITENCYHILGLIHSKYKPVNGKLHDYITNPKPNGYRSIHTTIYTGDGGSAEVQIRTKEMHDDAEYGITSHVAYDESGKSSFGGRWSNKLTWVRELVDLAKKSKSTNEFAEAVKLDYFKNQIFVFTPNGDVVELPEDATPVDFAYHIHSSLGDHAHSAKINGKQSSLDHTLVGGETIFIETNKNAHPSVKWLPFAKSTNAR